MDIIIEKCSEFEHEAFNTTHFITTNTKGHSIGNYASCNLGRWCGEEPETTQQNTESLCRALGITPKNLCVPREIHGNNVVVIKEAFFNEDTDTQTKLLASADALVTTTPRIAIAVSTADCVPILCTDNENFVACIHAGWRGIISGIIHNTILSIKQNIKNHKTLIFMIGPCISADNYEIGEEVWKQFEKQFTTEQQSSILNKKTETKFFPDLRKAAMIQIRQSIAEAKIFNFHADTFSDNRFYSVRKSGSNTGRFLTGIILN